MPLPQKALSSHLIDVKWASSDPPSTPQEFYPHDRLLLKPSDLLPSCLALSLQWKARVFLTDVSGTKLPSWDYHGMIPNWSSTHSHREYESIFIETLIKQDCVCENAF